MTAYKIAYKALSHGEHTFNFKVDGSLFDQYDYSEVHGGECDVDINMIYSDNLMNLEVEIKGEVIVECDRCLEDCTIDIDYAAPLVVKVSGEVSEASEVNEESDGDVLWIPESEAEIDLTQYIYESIILSLPYQRVHPEGECNPEMIARFQIINQREFDELEANAGGEESKSIDNEQLAKLEALKKMMNNNE